MSRMLKLPMLEHCARFALPTLVLLGVLLSSSTSQGQDFQLERGPMLSDTEVSARARVIRHDVRERWPRSLDVDRTSRRNTVFGLLGVGGVVLGGRSDVGTQ